MSCSLRIRAIPNVADATRGAVPPPANSAQLITGRFVPSRNLAPPTQCGRLGFAEDHVRHRAVDNLAQREVDSTRPTRGRRDNSVRWMRSKSCDVAGEHDQDVSRRCPTSGSSARRTDIHHLGLERLQRLVALALPARYAPSTGRVRPERRGRARLCMSCNVAVVLQPSAAARSAVLIARPWSAGSVLAGPAIRS